MVNISSIRPGLGADIVVGIDYSNDVIDIRGSIIYDVLGKRIIMANTNPPFKENNIGRKIKVTYLRKETEGPLRYGFDGKIVDIIENYELASLKTVSAFVVERLNNPDKTNIRMFFRVGPRENSGICLFLEGEKMNIIDISVGGAKVTHFGNKSLKNGEKVKGTLSLDKENFDIEAKILRVWQTERLHNVAILEFVTLQFLNIDSNAKDILAGKIREIERGLLRRDAALE